MANEKFGNIAKNTLDLNKVNKLLSNSKFTMDKDVYRQLLLSALQVNKIQDYFNQYLLPTDPTKPTEELDLPILRAYKPTVSEDGILSWALVTAEELPDTSKIIRPQGEKGDKGDMGIGVPAGGTTGQVLKKVSGTDYDTEWSEDNGGVGIKGTGECSELFNNYELNEASGSYSHAEGHFTSAIGNYSHAEGYSNKATGESSHAEGNDTEANGFGSHAEGHETIASGAWGSHAEGYAAKAEGESSHSEGNHTIASGNYSHAEGNFTSAIGNDSHAEGFETTASGGASHAEGTKSIASSSDSHAEGYATAANGLSSHAEGSNTEANGFGSHAEGYNTKAFGRYQHVQGKYNISDTNGEGEYAHIVGNGSSDEARSNAHTLDWSGNAWYAGKVSVGTTDTPANPTEPNDLTTKEYVDKALAGVSIEVIDNLESTATNKPLSANQGKVLSEYLNSKVDISNIIDNLTSTDTDKPLSAYQGKVLSDAIAQNNDAITQKKGASGTAEGAEIFNNYGNILPNKATGMYSHAEGINSHATGYAAHSEGSTRANGNYSHAEGTLCQTNGDSSHAEGSWTIASGNSQHVQGKFNIEDTENKYAHIVGNGASADKRSNAHTLDWSGNAWFAGKVSGGTIESPAPVENDNDYVTKKYFDENAGGGSIDIIDNLESTDTNKALSANQGKILNDTISSIYEQFDAFSPRALLMHESPIIQLVFNTAIAINKVVDLLSNFVPSVSTGRTGQNEISRVLETNAYQGIYCVHLDRFGGSGYALAVCNASFAADGVTPVFTVEQMVFISEYSETNLSILQQFYPSFTYTEAGWQNTSEFILNENSTIYSIVPDVPEEKQFESWIKLCAFIGDGTSNWIWHILSMFI